VIVIVGAALVRDGRLLAARRTTPREAAGRWEFPGGKVDPGETADAAVMREVAEELGCEARVEQWLDGGEPVGLLQSWWEPDPPRRGGIDGFLIPSARGRGVMPAIARQLAADLRAQGWAEVTVDPYEWNERAIRGWEKAGFVEVSRGHAPDEDHSAEWVLMRFSG